MNFQSFKEMKLDNTKRGMPLQGGKVDLDLWPLDQKSVSPLIIHNLHVRFEIDWSKTVVAMVSTR